MTLNINSTTTPNPNNKFGLLAANNNSDAVKNSSVGLQTKTSTAEVNELKEDKVELQNKSEKAQKEYNDPLLKWPWRGLAFTNDVGAAVMDIAPGLGMGLWVPALMYFGADIYDKYKSDQQQYEPSGKRAFKQAVFQACASVILPIVVVHNGQKAASMMAQKSKNGMSLQMQEEVDQFTVQLLKRRKLKDYEGDIDGFKKEFNEHLKNHLQDHEKSMETKNPFKLLKRWIFGSKHSEKLTPAKLKKVEEYSNKNIDEMFEIRRDLLEDKRPKGISNKLMKLYDNTKRSFAKDKNTIEGHIEDAIKETLKQRQRDRLFNTKLWKTAGGFIALGASIQFIDHFVEKYVIQKLVEPGLENIEVGKNGLQFGKRNKQVKKA